MIRAVRRRLFRAGVRGLARAMRRAPHVVLRIADALAPLVFAPMSRVRLAEVFPELAPAAARGVIAHGRRFAMRNFVLAESVRLDRDFETVRKLVLPNERLATLPHPTILGTFHLGALAAIGIALEQLPGRVLALRATPKLVSVRSNLTIEMTRGDEQHRARVFHRAIQFLNAGDFVFVPLDPEESTRIAVPFRGRTLHLARGPFALSRITGAPIQPIIARWNGTNIEFVIGDAIPSSNDESALAAAAASWLERHLLAHPLDISDRVLALTE